MTGLRALVGVLLVVLAARARADELPAPPFRPAWCRPDHPAKRLGWQDGGYPAQLALSSDGARLVRLAPAGAVEIELAHGNPRLISGYDWGRDRSGGLGDLSSAGAALAGGVIYHGQDDGRVRRWRLTDGRRLPDLVTGGADRIEALRVSPDGSRLAAGDVTGRIWLWRLADGRRLQTLGAKGVGKVRHLAFRPDGRQLATCSDGAGLSVWRLSDGERLLTVKGDEISYTRQAGWSRDGRILYSLPGREDAALVARDATTLRPLPARGLGRLDGGHTPQVLAAGRRWLALATYSHVWVVPIDGRGPIRRLEAPPGTGIVVYCLAWSADGDWLTVAAPACALRWHIPSGALVSPTGHVGGVAALVAGPGGRWLASLGVDQTVRLWDPRSGWQHAIGGGTPEQPGGRLSALARSPDGRWLVAGGRTLLRLRVPDLALGGPRFEPPASTIRALAWTPDGQTLIGAGDAGDIELWDAASGRRRCTLRGLRGPVVGLAVDPHGRWLAAGGFGGPGVAVWSLPGGSTLGRVATAGRAVLGLAARADGQLAVATDRGRQTVDLRGALRRLDVPASPPERPSAGPARPAQVLVSRDGRRPLVPHPVHWRRSWIELVSGLRQTRGHGIGPTCFARGPGWLAVHDELTGLVLHRR